MTGMNAARHWVTNWTLRRNQLARDIDEMNNLAARDPTRVERLARLLTGYLRSVDAQMPVDTRTGKPVGWPLEALGNR